MHCYYHPSVVAVGICKNCLKALCPESVTDVGDGLACRGQCEERVRLCNLATRRSVAALQDAPRNNLRLAFIIGGFALIPLVAGLVTLRSGGVGSILFGLFGLAFAVLLYASGRKMQRATADLTAAPLTGAATE